MKKSLIAILTATIILLSSLVPLLYIQPANAADPSSWYMTVPGVLDSDTYTLYPYNVTRTTIGFSQFGEMINGPAGIGLMYGNSSIQTENIDAFAADTYVPEFEWNQGWLINITYSYSGEYRNVWAFALYSDSYSDPGSIGGNWQMAPSPDSTTVIGGRKYGGVRYGNGTMLPIGYATTAPLTVLYNGPRSFIALCKNTIGEDANTPLVGVYITIVFDKVKKYVTLYKDVKLLDQRKFTGDLQVEFSNRGEWDLGLALRPASFAHWFEHLTNSYETGYHPFYQMPTTLGSNAPPAHYDVAQVISSSTPGYVGYAAYWPTPISIWMEATYLTGRTEMLSSLETTIAKYTGNGTQRTFSLPTTPVQYPRGQGIWKDDPMVFVDGVLKPEDELDPQGWQWISGNVVFNIAPSNGAKIWIEYKQYVHKTDMSDSPRTPYIIGEWDFALSWANVTASTNQFRGVTVYGITDDHDASSQNLDREVQYQLDEVFNPFDLHNAVEKSTNRWVEFSDDPIDSTHFVTDRRPVMDVSDSEWDQYGVFSERVIDLTTDTLLNRWAEDYTFSVDSNGYGHFGGLDETHYYKFLYSTDTVYYQEPFNITRSVTNATLGAFDFDGLMPKTWTDRLSVSHSINAEDFTFSVTNASATDFPTNQNLTFTYTPFELEWGHNAFKVFKEDSPELEIGAFNWETVNVTSAENGAYKLQFHLNFVELNWDIQYSPQGDLFTDMLDVHFYDWDFDVWPVITVRYSNETGNFNLTVTATLEFLPDSDGPSYLYQEKVPGRYEWVTVGRDASTVDSAGATVVAAAFKDKQVEIGNAAMDMNGLTYQGQIPYLLSKTTSGLTPDFKNYWITPDTTSPGQRLSLADDWCTRYPVSSSNIIAEGGPLANQITEYFNSFTTAFYGEPWFTPYAPWQGAIVALSDWSAWSTTSVPVHYYVNSGGQNGTGYATIGTYLDINGTVGLVIYGLDARDTYYASKFFYEDIIQELQDFPAGATSIVLKIDYEDAKHPTFTIPEVLGTISETLVLGSTNIYLTSALKGGIHPDP